VPPFIALGVCQGFANGRTIRTTVKPTNETYHSSWSLHHHSSQRKHLPFCYRHVPVHPSLRVPRERYAVTYLEITSTRSKAALETESAVCFLLLWGQSVNDVGFPPAIDIGSADATISASQHRSCAQLRDESGRQDDERQDDPVDHCHAKRGGPAITQGPHP